MDTSTVRIGGPLRGRMSSHSMVGEMHPPTIGKPMVDMNIPFTDVEIQKLRGCTFLSNSRLKKSIRDFRPKGIVNIIRVFHENGIPYRNIKAFLYPEEVEGLMVELATLADLHGIIKLSGHSIWVKQIGDVRELNMDGRLIDRLSRSLTGKGFAP